MGKRKAPPPPDILRKSGPHKNQRQYDRKRAKEEDRRQDMDEGKDDQPRPD